MDDHYAQLLAKETPQRSVVKSSFIQKCISFGSTKKGLTFENSVNDDCVSGSGEASFSFNQGNETRSGVSGIFEMDVSNRSKMSFANSPVGDFSISSKFNLTNISKMDLSNVSKMDMTNLSKIDMTNLSKMDMTSLSKMDMTSLSKMDMTSLSKMDMTSLSKVDFPSLSSINSTNMSKMDFSNVSYMNSPKMAKEGIGNLQTSAADAVTKSTTIDSLYEDFLEFFLHHSTENEIFDLLSYYENMCCRGFETISKMAMKNTFTESNFTKISSMLTSLQLERNTWRLFRVLFQDRLEVETFDEGEMLMATLGRTSDKQIVDNLYQKDAYIRQSQLIVDWLEKNNEEDIQSTFFDRFEHFTDKCIALEHSLNELTTGKFNNHRGNHEMDPDATFRQTSYPLHETDKENERRLFKFMFICIRAGKLDEAQLLAERFGEAWLAAALEGWRLHHDPNYETEVAEGQELQALEGNKYRDLWKVACWEASQSPAVHNYEQAIYGSLCGNLKAVLSVCQTWEDYLWAYARTSLDKLIEREIRNFTQQDRSLEELPMEYWDKVLDVEEIFHELEASAVKSHCKTPHHVIQKYIILDDLSGLVEEMYSWLNQNLDGQTLRCMAHIILFLRVIGRSTKEELCVPILEAYVQVLINAHKASLVAPYVSTLPKVQQVIWYARFLEGITSNSEREKCLRYAEEAGLDVPEITKSVVKNIREKDPIKMEGTALLAATTQDDFEKINAIDWLIFNPSQRSELLKQANALMRIFVAQNKMDAAKLVFNKIPSDCLSKMNELAKANGLEELPADDENAMREYLCFTAYLEAMDAFNNWFHHSIHGKPKQPLPPFSQHVSFKDKVAHEHEMAQFQKDLERWQDVVTRLATIASKSLTNVLLFVDGGWMIDQRTERPSDAIRQQQMSNLRKLCIPQVTQLLQNVYMAEEKYQESIQLADVILSERNELYKEFSKEDLQQFLKVSLDSSYSLLDMNMEPLGYSSKFIEIES